MSIVHCKNNNTVILSILAVFLCCISCKMEVLIPELGEQDDSLRMKTETIHAHIGSDVKVSIASDSGVFSWTEATDLIAVHTTGGYVISSGASSTGASASFTVTYEESDSRDAYAVYPYTLVYNPAAGNYYSVCEKQFGLDEKGLSIMLPTSYALTDIQDEKTICPMIASNVGDSWAFRQICGLLRLSVNGIPDGTSYLVVDFNGQKVSGRFVVESPIILGTSSIATKQVSDATDQITITGIGGDATFNLPLPTGDYHTITLVAYGSDNVPLTAEHLVFHYTAKVGKGKKLVCSALTKGIFTIKEGEYAIFAPGNLKCIPSTNVWSFHDRQYDVCETVSNTNVSSKYTSEGASEIDLFGWGTSGWDNTSVDGTWVNYQPYATSNTTTDESNNVYKYGPSYARADKNLTDANFNGDWGNYNSIGYDIAGTWHTLTSWAYVLNTRTVSNTLYDGARYTKAILGGLSRGLIIFPDHYNHPEDTGFISGSFNSQYSGFTSSVSFDGWAKMEKAGAVFLPAAGYRDGSTIKSVGTTGSYWSASSNNASKAYYLYFSNANYYSANADNRCKGFAVRLVRDIIRMNGQAVASISDVTDDYQDAW